MKRGAERQISKDDDDEIEEVEDPVKGFQKADESVLTKRQIRGLPKRAMPSNKASSFTGLSNAPPSLADSEPQKFGGFGGFGSGAPSPFLFTPSAPSTTSSVASSASAATKSFASVVQSASTANSSQLSQPSTSDDNYEAALRYYKSVRGLNVSFLSAIQKAVDQDPFVDIAGLLESYKNLRTTVQTDLDSSSKAPSQKASAAAPGPSAPPAPEKTAPSTTGFPVPKGFSGFSGFGSASLPTPSTNSNTSTDKSSAPQSAFSFSTSSSSTVSAPTFGVKPSEVAPTPTAAAFSTSEAPKSAFSFGTKSDDAGSSKSTSFSFAAPPPPTTSKSKEDSSSSAFGSSSAIPNFFASSSVFSEPSSKPTSAFATTTSLFGTSTDSSKPSPFTPGSSDLFNKVSTKRDAGKEESKSGNLFGTSSTPTINAFGSTATTPDKPSSAFGTFGGGSPPKGNGFTFGKVGGSIGNPVGFGFGVAKPADGASEPSSSNAPAEFSFGAPLPKSVSPSTEATGRSESQPAGSDGGVQDDAKLLPTSNHDGEGEGEENEETMYTVRCRLFKLTKTSDKSEWKDLGIGMFRLKKHKENGARRALMRNSATGRIIINFRLYATLSPTLMKSTISFVGHDDGVPVSFRIRVKTAEQAQELKDAFNREVAAVKESN